MKLYRFVSYASLGIIVLAILLLLSLPFRFPNSIIAWEGAILFLSPAVVLVVLLFVKPLVSKKVFLFLTVGLVGLALWLTREGWMSPILFAIFFVACFVLYFVRSTPRPDLRYK